MSSKPAMSLSSVVLPQPEGPKSVKNSLSYLHFQKHLNEETFCKAYF